jgi:hypothetical protein
MLEAEVKPMRRQVIRMLLWLAPAAALAQGPSKVLVSTAKEVMTDVVTPGTIACVGGAPTNNPQGPPCSPGTKQVLVSYRVTRAEYQEITGSAAGFIKGQVEVVVHCNLDGNRSRRGECNLQDLKMVAGCILNPTGARNGNLG